MRRQLAFVTLAVASLVVIAFLVPLGVLVRDQAADRALTRAERFGESVAAALAVASGTQTAAAVEPRLAEA
ncbi:MAG: two-component sensor histidine kinase, partial [Acidimicrobiia bacterium]|nr:two-component sensor histidine kinase [Acidimicrobiia bacterium]